MRLLKEDMLRTVEKRGVRWLWSNFTSKQFYWLLVAYALPMMTVQAIVSSLSTALFTGAMLAMCVITVQIAIDSEKLHARKNYLTLFQYFTEPGVQIGMNVPKKDALHYGNFFTAMMVALVSLSFSNQSIIRYEILAVISVVVSLVILLQFDVFESPLMAYILLAKAPAWLVMTLEKGLLLISKSPPQILQQPLLSIPLFFGMTFDINLVTIIQVPVHVYVHYSQLRRLNWETFLSQVGPEILFLCWIVLCRNFVSKSDPLTLLAMSLIVILIPLSSFLLILSPAFFLYQCRLTSPFFYSVVFVLFAVVLILVVALTFRYLEGFWMKLSLEYLFLIIVAVAVVLAMFFSAWYVSFYEPPPLKPVTLKEYSEYCGPGNWQEDQNMVQTQINCIHLQNRVFDSQGRVKSVSISKMTDRMAKSLSFLPLFMRKALTCYMGEWKPMCGNRDDMSTCVSSGCHFHHSLAYTFEVELDIPLEAEESVGATVYISGHHERLVRMLRKDMLVHFNATFLEGMGSDHLTLQALEMSVTWTRMSTRQLEEEREKEMLENMFSNLISCLKNTASILLEMIFGYTP